MTSTLDLFRLDGRVALVTGAGSGLGFAFAEALAEAGAAVACADIDGESAERAAARVRALGGSGIACTVDVADEAQVEATFERLERELGAPQIAFANAGIAGAGGKLEEPPTEDWRRVIDVDLTGTYLTVRAAARRMIAQGYGKIIATGSMYSLRGDPLFGIHAYSAAKSGVAGLVRTAAVNLGPRGVRINAILPGYIETAIGDGALFRDEPESKALLDQVVTRLPLRRVGQPEELKGLALFLASPASDYCTGCLYPIDGGWLAT